MANYQRTKTAFTRCRHVLKTMKNVTVAKIELAFTRCRNNLKTVGNMTVKILCKTLVPKKCIYILRTDHSHSKSVEKCSVYIIFEYSHDAVSKICRLEFRFQNLLFSKSAGKNVLFLCERETYPSHFSPFSKSTDIV